MAPHGPLFASNIPLAPTQALVQMSGVDIDLPGFALIKPEGHVDTLKCPEKLTKDGGQLLRHAAHKAKELVLKDCVAA